MPIRPEQHYFGAGPAMLPTDAIAQLSSDIVSYLNNGIGITEISHRSADAVAVINDAKADLVKVLDIPDTHDVIFAQAGGTGGFAMVAYNMMSYYAYKHGKTGVANYLVTGAWSKRLLPKLSVSALMLILPAMQRPPAKTESMVQFLRSPNGL